MILNKYAFIDLAHNVRLLRLPQNFCSAYSVFTGGFSPIPVLISDKYFVFFEKKFRHFIIMITLHLSPELEHTLRSKAERAGIDLDSYILRVLEQTNASRAMPFSREEKEIELIFHINQQGLEAREWQRYNELKKKRADESLSRNEHEEIVRFSERLEEMNVHRLKYLLELAQLRDTGLDEVMHSLGIQAPEYE